MTLVSNNFYVAMLTFAFNLLTFYTLMSCSLHFMCQTSNPSFSPLSHRSLNFIVSVNGI